MTFPGLDALLASSRASYFGRRRYPFMAVKRHWTLTCKRTTRRLITWLKTNRHLNKMCVGWLDKIEDFRFGVTHLPSSRHPADPLTQRGFADGCPGRRCRQGTPIQKVSRSSAFSSGPRRTILSGARRRSRWVGGENRRVAAVTFADVEEGHNPLRARGGVSPPCTSMFVALA